MLNEPMEISAEICCPVHRAWSVWAISSDSSFFFFKKKRKTTKKSISFMDIKAFSFEIYHK